MTNNSPQKITLALSGASGAIYGHHLLKALIQAKVETHLVATNTAIEILAAEIGINDLTAQSLLGHPCDSLYFHDNHNLHNTLASGSFPIDAMVICPCSSHTIASIAAGLADTLLLRAAYVTLKQRRPLILVHRETPLTEIDLENMLKITRAGGIICPASPAFYMKPQSIDDLANSMTGRILDLLNIPHKLPIRWSPE